MPHKRPPLLQVVATTPGVRRLTGVMRTFESGATRDNDDEKLDYEGFLSPLVLRAFAGYMHKHRVQADGELRASDNWQKGIPMDQCMKSMLRHVFELWEEHRTEPSAANPLVMVDALCAIIFNTQSYLLELLKKDWNDYAKVAK